MSQYYCPSASEGNRLKMMFDITREILSVDDPDVLLKKIVHITTDAFRAQGCILRLKEDDGLRVRAFHGVCEDTECTPVREVIPIGEGVCGKAALLGRTLLFDSRVNTDEIVPATKNVQTAVCSPLLIGERIIGTFSLYNRLSDEGTVIPFTEDDRLLVEGFASTAALVIDRAITYDKVEELKDYLQGLIDNTADAIVTTDLNEIVTSWNTGAENIFGYGADEVVGAPLPIIPHFLVEAERGYSEQVRRGETIREVDTARLTKQGKMIDVSITLSPIKNSAGIIIGVSRIARDITEKKRVEKELVRKNIQMQRLFFISSAMRGTLELDRVLRMVLTVVTVSDGLGFNRAMLFLVDENAGVIKGAMGVGPASHEEAWEIWSKLSHEQRSLEAILDDVQAGPLRKDSFMDRLCCGVEIAIDSDTILTRAVKEKRAFNVWDARGDPQSDTVLIQQLGTMAYAAVPLIARDKVIGVLWVDNLYSQKQITEHDMEFLQGFTDQIASAIENARLFEQVMRAEQELENIFESISDLVFFVDRDFTIRKVNKAVVDKIGLPESSIIGQRCFWIFHGLNMPWQHCPHMKTVETKAALVGEIEDPHLGGTYLISSSPIFEKAGELLGTVHIARDISELKQLREKMVSVERMAALGEMAAKVAHEIRNPLLSIGGFAGRLQKRLEGGQKEQARIIVDEVQRLEAILNGILGFVRTAHIEKKPVMLSDLVHDALFFMEPQVLERRNKIRLDMHGEIRLLANYDRLKEALLNLLANANQSSDGGEIVVRVYRTPALAAAVGADSAEHYDAVVEVEDFGTGIRPEDIGRIFDPFFTTRPVGTGLGLSITKRIIEEHEGTISVQSSPGRGAHFVVHLPIKEGEA